MADAKVKVTKVKRMTMQVEKKVDDYAHGFVRINSTITDDSRLTSIVLEVILEGSSRNVKTTLPNHGKQLLWLQAIRDAISETLEELKKILPAE